MPSVQTSSRNENFVNTSKNLLKKWKLNFHYSVLFHMKREFVSNILWIIVKLLHQSLSLGLANEPASGVPEYEQG